MKSIPYFWSGFLKRAGILELWQKESKDEDAAEESKSKDNNPINNAELGNSFPPDVYWRPWP